MIVNIDDIENNSDLDADLCIIGGGAAGITIARELIGSTIKVCLVESGNTFFEKEVQALYDAENVGIPYSIEASRLRFFGGTTNHWTGNCAPLEDFDFEKRPWVPYSGWPYTKKTLEPYYQRAHRICDLGPYIYDERLLQGLDISTFPLLPEKLYSKFWQRSTPHTRFGVAYKAELEKASNIKILLNANLTGFTLNHKTKFIQFALIKSLEEKKVRIKARAFVLACGGIENARLLLLEGLGNENDLVGRFFMAHTEISCGGLVPKNSPEEFRLYSMVGPFAEFTSSALHSKDKNVEIFSKICLSEKLQERQKLLGSSITAFPEWDPEHGIIALQGLYHAFKKGQTPDDLGGQIWKVMKDLDEVSVLVFDKFFGTGEKISTPLSLRLRVISEQAPNPDSRVTLSEQRDKLGFKKVKLDWRLTEIDKRSVQAMIKTLGMEMGRLNLGRVKMDKWLIDSKTDYWPPNLIGQMHHMGTTRMSEDPKKGVVDIDCRIHELYNLYVAGSSVFPTGGFVNPTLTIVALALRLADHLKNNLKQ